MKRLLLTGAYSYSDTQKLLLEKLGFEIDFLQYEESEIKVHEKYNAIVCNNLFSYHSNY